MRDSLAAKYETQPQWTTSSRLLKLGEAIEFRLYLPAGSPAEQLSIFPRYLERAQPGNDFEPGGNLSWLDRLPTERLSLAFGDGWGSASYTPEEAGSYLARWRVGEGLFFRYFSAARRSLLRHESLP